MAGPMEKKNGNLEKINLFAKQRSFEIRRNLCYNMKKLDLGDNMPLMIVHLAAAKELVVNQLIWGNRILNWLIALGILAAAFFLRRLLARLGQLLLQHIRWKN